MDKNKIMVTLRDGEIVGILANNSNIEIVLINHDENSINYNSSDLIDNDLFLTVLKENEKEINDNKNKTEIKLDPSGKTTIYIDMYYTGSNGHSEYLAVEVDNDYIIDYNIKLENSYSCMNDEFNYLLEKQIKNNKYFDYPHEIIIIDKETYFECV